MKKKANKAVRGDAWSEVSNVHFRAYRLEQNRFAKEDAPPASSLRALPEADFAPDTVLKSVRLPSAIWEELEQRALAEGVAVHVLVRKAILGLLRRAD